MHQPLTDKQQQKILLERYFSLIMPHFNEAVSQFKQRKGYNVNAMHLLFKNDFESWEREYQQLNNEEVILQVEAPLVDHNSAFVISCATFLANFRTALTIFYAEKEIPPTDLEQLNQLQKQLKA